MTQQSIKEYFKSKNKDSLKNNCDAQNSALFDNSNTHNKKSIVSNFNNNIENNIISSENNINNELTQNTELDINNISFLNNSFAPNITNDNLSKLYKKDSEINLNLKNKSNEDLNNNCNLRTKQLKRSCANHLNNTPYTNNKIIIDDDNSSYNLTKKSSLIKTSNYPSNLTNSKSLIDNNNNNNNNNNTSYKANIDTFANPEKMLPDFLKVDSIRDINGNKPESPDYDPTTLFIPDNYLQSQTASMNQYWQFKKTNFDKVILFKLGKFYELFYDDAIIGNQVLNLKWMGNNPSKLHVGFPEVNLMDKAYSLIQKGFKVGVVEQTEKAVDKELRLKNRNSSNNINDCEIDSEFATNKKTDKLARRELTQVLTKGSLDSENTKYNKTNYDTLFNNNYIVFISKFNVPYCYSNTEKNETVNNDKNIDNLQEAYCVIIVDLFTNKLIIKEIKESLSNNNYEKSNYVISQELYRNLCSFLYKISPTEIVYLRGNISNDIINFVNKLSIKPQITSLKNNFSEVAVELLLKKWILNSSLKNNEYIINSINLNKDEDFNNINNTNFDIINKILKEPQENAHILYSLFTCIKYLENILKAESFFPVCTIINYENTMSINSKYMVLDFLTISKLELLETKLDSNDKTAGSINSLINKATTSFGKRRLTQWLLNPLMDIYKINERLNTIEIISNYDSLFKKIENKLRELPDLERLVSKVYQFSIKTSSKAVYFDNVSQKKLKDFVSLLNHLNNCLLILELCLEFIKDENLNNTTKSHNNNDLLKNNLLSNLIINNTNNIKCTEIINYLKNIIVVQKDKDNNILEIIPKKGTYVEYDQAKEELTSIKNLADDELSKIKVVLKTKDISFTNNRFSQFEFEVPESIVMGSKKPKDFEMTSTRKGYQRFTTQKFKNLEFELEVKQNEIEKLINIFNINLFNVFYQSKDIWDILIDRITSLDCIMGLCNTSCFSNLELSRPYFVDDYNHQIIEFKDLVHPVLKNSVSKFVPNDVLINNDKRLIFITGPNMGGKSTLLRQISIAIIMAQIGCYIPASFGKLSLVDRIFTRIGAKDDLLQGKSTFFVEMEELKIMLEQATQKSLLIIDELGRGTSTEDGKLIAKKTINYIVNNINSRTLFTTHYHEIIDWVITIKKVDMYYMDSNVIDDVKRKIKFLYKFKKGVCNDSFAIEVAKLAGISDDVLSLAEKYLKNGL